MLSINYKGNLSNGPLRIRSNKQLDIIIIITSQLRKR